MRPALKQWWQMPGGGREVLSLAIPLVISTSSWTIMHFIDRVFLFWYSADAVAAALPAGMLSFSIESFFLGVAAYVNTFVAQYHGAGRPHRIGLAVWQGIALGFVSAPILIGTIPLAPWLFELVGHAPAVREYEVIYYQVTCYGGGGLVVSAALSSFFTGRGHVRTVMIVDSLGALTNVVLDYAWIFGHWGFPELGLAGAAWATVVSLWMRTAIYFALFLMPANRQRYGTVRGCRIDTALLRRLLRFGSPAGVQMLLEVAGFTGFLMVVGWLGPDEHAATNLAFTINALAFVPMLGFGLAVTTLVGQHLGENRPQVAARGVWSAYVLATLYVAVVALLYLATPHWFLLAHAANSEPGQFARISDAVRLLLRFVAAYSLFDAMNIVFVSALKGAGDTRFILLTSLCLCLVPIVLPWVGLAYFDFGLVGCWSIATLWVCTFGTTYLLRFLQGKWRSMRVIEPYDVGDEVDEIAEPAVVAVGELR
ncbi:MAG: MATE family efflux transporter [Pirellulales bacterium]